MHKPKNENFFCSTLFVMIIFSFFLSGCPSKGGDALFPSGPSSIPGGSTNSAPTANAGSDQSVTSGDLVVLDGSGSSDSDGDFLIYNWLFTSKPDGSNATLSSAYAVSPNFIVDKPGSYVVQLIVNDGTVNSTADTVTVTAAPSVSGNTPPIANAGPDQSLKTGALVTLDGSNSIDIDLDFLTYTWSFLQKPAGSLASLSTTTDVNPAFTADKDGYYIIQLIVNDGKVDSTPDTITVTAATPVVVHVPDTGQTGDYTATPGEDSDYTIYPPSYAINGGGTVTDNITGLMWQQQDDGTRRDWNAAVSYCGNLTLGGLTGWRLPDNKELMNIVDYGRSKPSIDPAVFPNTQSAGYWTSTEYGLDPTSAWDVVFDSGGNDTSKTAKTNPNYVRCVRGGQTVPILNDNGDGTITDETTGLIWQQADDNIEKKWDDALLYCKSLPLGAHNDWRLPNAKEMLSLTDYRYWPFTINPAYFPSTLKQKGTALPNYWSSTSVASNSNQAWGEKFLVGLVINFNKSGAWFVRCVR